MGQKRQTEFTTVAEAMSGVRDQINREQDAVAQPEITNEKLKELQCKFGDMLVKQGYDRREPMFHGSIAGLMAKLRAGMARKGIFIHGTAGSGKTMAMRLLSDVFMCRFFAARELAIKDVMDRSFQLDFARRLDYHRVQDRIVDDLGRESKLHDFGKITEPLDLYISDRYCKWQDTGALTHFTTNCTEEQLSARYGDRITSRLHEMCVWVGTGNKDWRRENPVANTETGE